MDIDFSEHIESNPEILGGTPVIRGTRVSVTMIQERIRRGDLPTLIVRDYPYITIEQLFAAACYPFGVEK